MLNLSIGGEIDGSTLSPDLKDPFQQDRDGTLFIFLGAVRGAAEAHLAIEIV
jgi:hypothetical protein